jgi:hypothetical protein
MSKKTKELQLGEVCKTREKKVEQINTPGKITRGGKVKEKNGHAHYFSITTWTNIVSS